MPLIPTQGAKHPNVAAVLYSRTIIQGRRRHKPQNFVHVKATGLMDDYDVVIVGAGPTGLAAGLFLHAHGARVALLERAGATVVEPRAVTLDDESLRAMATLGLMPQIEPMILPSYGMRWMTGDGRELARVSSNASRYGYGVRNGFSQPQFVNLLASTLAERADIFFDTEVTSVEQNADGAQVHARELSGRERTLRARFVIACDGAASPIREALNVRLEGDTHAQPWLIVDTINSTETNRASVFSCGLPRPYVAVPGRDGRLRYEFMYLPGEDPEQMKSIGDVRRWLTGRRDLRDEDVVRIAVYKFHSRISPTWRSGALFMAGDAAHLMPPFAGQGMNAGIRDAFNLAWKLAFVIRGLATDALLDTYERERKPHVAAMLRLSEVIGTVVMARNSPTAAARDYLLGTARHVPGVREYIAEMRFKPKVAIARGLAPNPLVFNEQNALQRLDAILGPGFSLIAVSPTGHPPVPGLHSELFDRLGAERVRLCSGEHIPLPHADCVTVADTHGTFARELHLRGEQLVVVRPDRAVAATCALRDLPKLEAQLLRDLSLAR
jgi:3-(3-hydroxy-phenyl)propionate hydroxylase